MSSLALPAARRSALALYAVVLAVALFELFALWQAIHPHVSDLYRGFFLDRTTTCLNQPSTGDYAFGTELNFGSAKEAQVKPIRVCGWEGPVGDGLHAVGESSRLHLALPTATAGHDLSLSLTMVAVEFAAPKGQRVEVVANDVSLGTVQVAATIPQRFDFSVPAALLAGASALDVELKYPDAILVSPQDSNLRKRSIKLVALRLAAP